MKSKNIIDSLNGIDPKMIADAAPGQNRRRKIRPWIRFTTIAACAALIAASIPVGMLLLRQDGAPYDSDPAGFQNGNGSPAGNLEGSGPSDGIIPPGDGQGHPTGVGSPPSTNIPEIVPPFDGKEIDLNYLTARFFNPNRTAGAVSDQFRAAYADFALKLLTSCRTQNGSDTMISPLSIMTALAMTANGAKGDTLTQMESLLGGEMNIQTLNQQIFNFYSALSSTEAASFKSANSIWVTSQPHFSINPDFIEMIENTYDADVIGIDFADSKNAVDAINFWCWQKTDGMIPSIADESNLDASTVMALLNALTFDAKWANPYTKGQCRNGVFHGANGNTSVTMLRDSSHYGYIEGEHERGFIRYYEGRKYAFVALLPNENGNISDYLASLSGSYLLYLIQNPVVDPDGYTLITELPSFKKETSLDLSETLKKLGMTDAFSILSANFSGLGHSDLGNLIIGNVIHKTFIEVNNEGTRAAAVTEVIMPPALGIPPAREERVILDRPFVYAIIDTATSLPIFIGSCENIA